MIEHRVRVVQQEQIDDLHISPKQCVEWARQAFLLKDESQMPTKMSVHPQGMDFITSMPCLLPERDGKKYFGNKIVCRIEGQQPGLKSDILLYDALTGDMLAVVDGSWITAMRTGAVAALAAKTLQRKGVHTYSMMGLGNIARAVALCLIESSKAPIKLRLLRYKDQAESFAERLRGYEHVEFDIIDNRREFLVGADVLLSCVTVASELFFPDDSVFPKGITILPVHVRGFQNCDLFFDKVFGDDTDQLRGFRYFSQFRQFDEFHHVLQGKNPGRTSDEERILSYNYGLGLHDVFFASRIYEMMKQGDNGFYQQKHDAKIWL